MAAIDLRTIKFRPYASDGDDPETAHTHAPLAGSSTSKVNLAGIKFRAKIIGDETDPE